MDVLYTFLLGTGIILLVLFFRYLSERIDEAEIIAIAISGVLVFGTFTLTGYGALLLIRSIF